jgi:hypothetical protein
MVGAESNPALLNVRKNAAGERAPDRTPRDELSGALVQAVDRELHERSTVPMASAMVSSRPGASLDRATTGASSYRRTGHRRY